MRASISGFLRLSEGLSTEDTEEWHGITELTGTYIVQTGNESATVADDFLADGTEDLQISKAWLFTRSETLRLGVVNPKT